MERLVKLFLLLCLCLVDYEGAACSSPSPSPSPPSSNDGVYHHLCSDGEKTALLQFKSLFGENPPVLINWKDEPGSDCCSWDGVTCDVQTGDVIGLFLSDRQLHGAIPSNSTLFHLSHLQELDLSNNDFNGSHIFPSFGLNFPHLAYLDLSASNLAGSISSSEISHNWFTNLTELDYLDLSSNKLMGPVPTNISGLEKLTALLLGNNLLSGTLPPDFFDSLMLKYVDLSFNQLSGAIPTTKRVQNNSLDDFFDVPMLVQLLLSNNNLSGTLGPQLFLNFQHLEFLDLSHNSFQGSLPQLPPLAMNYFSVSHNKLEGDIPLSYCDLSMLIFLILSHNNLSGLIPGCIINPNLAILDLGTNSLHGSIPDNFFKGNKLATINLRGNRLQGKLPSSLANCTSLTVLDIGKNRIKDTFPYWLQSLPGLQVLVLRHNKFHGTLGGLIARTKGMETPFFPKLRIFDLSHNKFVGPLPSNYFLKLSAMRSKNNTGIPWLYMGFRVYDDTIEITLEGVDSDLPKILTIFAAIDLSDNKFEGEIPKDIGSLRGIQSLNLSSNTIAGTIPLTLANLTLLESLDLSSNQLSGIIPQELTRLTFLQMLNLSSNLLSGQIPGGSQFNTFDSGSYGGNLGLCGQPLLNKCFDKNGTLSPEEEDDDREDFFHGFTWKVVVLGYGCGTAFGLGVGLVIFKTGRPKRLVRVIEDELLNMTTKRPRGHRAIVFLSGAQRRRLGNHLS